LVLVLVFREASFARDVLLAAVGLATLLIPAIALGWAIRARGAERVLDLGVIAAAFGLAWLVLGALVLNSLPFGLSRWTWLGLAGVDAVLAIQMARSGARVPRLRLPARPFHGETAVLAGAIAVTVLALVVARVGVHQPTEDFTAISLERLAGGAFMLDLENQEGEQVGYHIDVTLDGQLVATFPSIVLPTGGDWTRQLAGPVAPGSRLEAVLYREAQPTVVYRRAVVWGAAATGDPGSTSAP
jgi:hypothetical protein